MSADYPGTAPVKTSLPPLLLVAPGVSRTPIAAPRCLCPPARVEGQPRVQNPFEVVTCPLPEGFDGDGSRCMLARQVSEVVRSIARSIQHVILRVDHDTNHRHLSFGDADADYAFEEGNLRNSRGR